MRTPAAAERHLLNRFSYGITQALLADVSTAGGASAWFGQQLVPDQVLDAAAAAITDWYPAVWRDPGVAAADDRNGGIKGFEVATDLVRWTLMRRLLSNRQVHEVMTDFWSNLLHVPTPEKKSWPWRPRYDATVREHALGRFDEMLVACVLHPAMGCYLDNAQSTAAELNENLGREVLELHTVGLGNYTEDEVKASARILTGWQVDVFGTYEAAYVPELHDVRPVKVLAFEDANTDRDGRDLSRRYLTYLAHHPETARRIAKRLAVRFVSDDPPAALVTHLAAVFLQSGTDIKATLRALVDSQDFLDSAGTKVRTPVEDAVATWRVLGVKPSKPSGLDSFAKAALIQASSIGQRPFDWPRPDGFPDHAEAWTGVSRVLNSFDVHKNVAGGAFPRQDVLYRSDISWLPRLPASLAEIVDALSRELLARPATRTLRAAVSARLELSMDYQVRSLDDFQRWRIIPLLATLLDTSAHMTR